MKRDKTNDLAEMRSEIKHIKKAMNDLVSRLKKLATALEGVVVLADPFCVTIQPGGCHSFDFAPTGRITITNETDTAGSIEMSWGSDTFSGEVQQTSTRSIEPFEWPVKIRNTGTVELHACPV